MYEIYSKTINCLKIVTFYRRDKVEFLVGSLGNSKKISNASMSEIVSLTNFETGILEKTAADFQEGYYKNHPITNWNTGISLLLNTTIYGNRFVYEKYLNER